jgi:hypothetical protein
LQKGENTDGWMAPRETPRIEGRGRHGSLMYRPRVPAVLEFSVSIPPGRHILRANYECEAGTHLFGDPTVYRQFGYVLSPAHTWTNFSGMDVTVHIPEGWHVSTNLALTQDGDKWSGRFEGVPADSLAITIQAPESSSFATVTYGAQALLLISVILGLVVAWWLGRRLGRRAASADVHARGYWGRHAWPWSAVFGLSWALVVAVTGTLAVYAPDWSLPSGQASHYGYGQAFATIGVVLLAVILAPIGFIITQVVAVVVASSARPSRTPRHVDQAV